MMGSPARGVRVSFGHRVANNIFDRLLQAEEAHVDRHPGGLEMFLWPKHGKGRFGKISVACLEVIVVLIVDC